MVIDGSLSWRNGTYCNILYPASHNIMPPVHAIPTSFFTFFTSPFFPFWLLLLSPSSGQYNNYFISPFLGDGAVIATCWPQYKPCPLTRMASRFIYFGLCSKSGLCLLWFFWLVCLEQTTPFCARPYWQPIPNPYPRVR